MRISTRYLVLAPKKEGSCTKILTKTIWTNVEAWRVRLVLKFPGSSKSAMKRDGRAGKERVGRTGIHGDRDDASVSVPLRHLTRHDSIPLRRPT